MGRMIESVSEECGCEVVGRIDEFSNAGGAGIGGPNWPRADVAIDFTSPAAFVENFPRLAALGINVVAGTTGWKPQEAAMRKIAADAGIGVVAAANFSVGVALFEALVADAARLFAARPEFGAWLHEIHHAAKLDAPSGTALLLRAAMDAAGFGRPVDVASSRAGSVPGTHTVGFDGPSETITLTHAARDRGAFARGALAAAHWVNGRRGWFTLKDVLGLAVPASSQQPVPSQQ